MESQNLNNQNNIHLSNMPKLSPDLNLQHTFIFIKGNRDNDTKIYIGQVGIPEMPE